MIRLIEWLAAIAFVLYMGYLIGHVCAEVDKR